MTPYYEDNAVQIWHGDCREVITVLPPVELVFSSPPYLNQRDYELQEFDWFAVIPEAIPAINITDYGQILINLGLKHENGSVIRYWDALIRACEAAGLRLFGWYVWDQRSGLPGDFQGRLAPSHEWIFHFNREVGNLNKSVAKFPDSGPMGSNMKNKAGVNGSRSSICFDSDKVHDSVFRIRRDSHHGTDHPAVFPKELASEAIQLFNGIVLDPFCGTGTTLRAAKDLGRKSIGIEIEEKYCEIAARRMEQEVLPLNDISNPRNEVVLADSTGAVDMTPGESSLP